MLQKPLFGYSVLFSRSESLMRGLLPPVASTMALLFASSSTRAWVTTRTIRNTKSKIETRKDLVNHRGICSLHSTITPPAEDAKSASSDTKESTDLVAAGTVISRFPGGLLAIRIGEELSNEDNSNTAENASSVSGDLQGKQVVLWDGSVGVVVAHRPPVAFAYAPDTDGNTKEASVQVLKKLMSVSVTDGCRVVDCFGRSILPRKNDETTDASPKERAIFAPIPQVKDIALINNPMLSGTTMIDTLAPIGRGQNMLMVGSDLSSMRGYAIDFIKTQLATSNTRCVYASTVESHESTLQRLRSAGISKEQLHIVAPSVSTDDADVASRSSEAITISGAACAIGEAYALEEGANSLVVVDTIDLHKKLWDTTTRVLVDVFGVDAVVEGDRTGSASSEMRAFYSSLIQRSAQYNLRNGGGSVTLLLLTTVPKIHSDTEQDSAVYSAADFEESPDKVKDRIQLLLKRSIPLTAANLRKIDIPVPSAAEGSRRLVLQHVDDLISMTDGQVWFDERLEGLQEPPLDPQRSLTRIGIGADTVSRADAPALRRVAEGLRLDLSQAASMDGAETTSATTKQTQRQRALLLAMNQEAGSGGRRLSESCVALLAASEGYLDQASGSSSSLVGDLLDHVSCRAAGSMQRVDDTLDISPEDRRELVEAIKSFFD